VSGFISQFKYQGKCQFGRVLGELLAEHLAHAYRGDAMPDLLIPVPLHTSRLRERGFNQAALLADQLGQAFDINVCHDLVSRCRPTRPQQGLGAHARRRNLGKAFVLTRDMPGSYRRIAIIDDVCTTMTTVRTIARLLHQHSPHLLAIHIWALARA
jgi:ComF family protein